MYQLVHKVDFDGYLAVHWGELQGISQQIHQNLLNALSVGEALIGPRHNRGAVSRYVIDVEPSVICVLYFYIYKLLIGGKLLNIDYFINSSLNVESAFILLKFT